MDQGFRLKVTWNDNDVLQLRVSAWNGTFGGAADVYVGMGELHQTAAKLEGFPIHPSDSREVTFGAFGPQFAGGAMSMRFYCADQSGHAYVEAKIESGDQKAGVVQSALVVIPIEAAAVDSFVDELCRLEIDKAGTARLTGLKS